MHSNTLKCERCWNELSRICNHLSVTKVPDSVISEEVHVSRPNRSQTLEIKMQMFKSDPWRVIKSTSNYKC